MRRYQVFAVGVSVALLLGAGTPAFAKSDKAKGHAYGRNDSKPPKAKGPKTDPKPEKTKPGHLSGGGTSYKGVSFSAQVRTDKLKQGHFNYTSGEDDNTTPSGPSASAAPADQVKVRCRNFTAATKTDANTFSVAAECVYSGPGLSKVKATLAATFDDNGDTGDFADILVTTEGGTVVVDDEGVIQKGNIKVH